jgi:hypothetical protein
MATSAIYTSDFEYELNQEIFINDFDPTTYWKCSSGIHFHSNINDVYAWLEFIDIPEELKVKSETLQKEREIEINVDNLVETELDKIEEIELDKIEEIKLDKIEEIKLDKIDINKEDEDNYPRKRVKKIEEVII